MSRRLYAILTLAAVVLPAAWAAADTITLKPEAYVKGPRVSLGEVAHIEGDNAEALARVEVAQAATPGSSRNLDAAMVHARVKHAGFDANPPRMEGASRVHTTTLHIELSQQMLAEDLRRFIEIQMPWDPSDTVLEVSPPLQSVIVPEGEVSISWRPNPQYRYIGSGAFRGEVTVDGEFARAVLCRADIEPYQDVVVAHGSIPRGTVLDASDLVLEKQPVSSIRGGAYGCVDEVAGLVARSTIFPGQVITNLRVEKRRLIRRNQMVNVNMRAGALRVTYRAKALGEGREGDLITCQNVESKQEFQGRVLADGSVEIE